ncbi:MAG TPA: hypothetical protein VMU58_10340 [Gaiellaceae bacterium]|nr:hypothetical protein [Gaiellaceae bacterium]
MADGVLLSGKERLRSFWLKFAAGIGPSLVLVVGAAAFGGGSVAYVMAVLGLLVGFVIATSARKPRGALVAGIAVALCLLLLQIVVAWFITHPIEKS